MSVETSWFGSNFITMKQCCEYVRVMRYKLHMMRIQIELPTNILWDNQYVFCKTSKPSSILKNKSFSITFHFVREGTAKDEWKTAYINTHLNPADMLTKSLARVETWSNFIWYVVHFFDWYTWWQWITFNCRTTVISQWLDFKKILMSVD